MAVAGWRQDMAERPAGRAELALMARHGRAPAPPAAEISAWWPAILLSAAGLVVAGYLTWLKLTGKAAVLCGPGSGCDLVQASRYGTLLGVPTALWGAAFYAVLLGLALTGLRSKRWRTAFFLAVAGAAFSLYLTWISFFVLRVACLYCLVSAGIAVALAAVLGWLRPAGRERQFARRWFRLGLEAAFVALASVVAGAFIHAGQSSPVAAQAALARHLTDTKAVMYGAFW
jgi:uncharacterized membrane protein